jgi:tape measure domain-containing protein
VAGDYSALTVAVQANTAALERSIAASAAKSGQAAGQTIGSKIGGAFSQVGKSVTAGLTVAAGAASVFAGKVIGAGVAYNTLYQSSSKAFTTILGSQAASQKMMADLEAFGKTSPFPRQAFISGTQQMLAFGFAAKDIIPTMSAVQDTVAATGGSAVDLSEIVTVLSQIKSAGKITGEDLMQLGGRGINAADLIGKAMGKSAMQIKTEITKGTLDANVALTALTGQMTARFGGAAAGLKQTWAGAKDSVKGSMRDVGSAIAEPFVAKGGGGLAVTWANGFSKMLRATIPVVKQIVAALTTKFAPVFPKIELAMASITQAITKFGKGGEGAIGPLIDKFIDLGKKFAPIIAGLLSLGGGKIAGALGPLGGILSSIVPGPLVAVLGTLIATSPEAQKALSDLASTVMTTLAPIMQQIGPLIGQIGVAAGPAFAALATALGQVVTAAAPLIPILAQLITGLVTQLMPILTPLIGYIGQLAQAMGPWGIGMAAGAVGVVKLGGAVSDASSKLAAFRAPEGGLDKLRGRFTSVGNAAKSIGGALASAGKAMASMAVSAGKATAALVAQGAAAAKSAVQAVALRVAQAASAAWTGIVTAAQWLWNLALTANPIGLIIVGIAALVAGFVLLYKKSTTVQKIVAAAFDGIKVAFGLLWTAAKAIVAGIVGVWKSMASVLGGVFNVLKTVIGVYIRLVVGYFKLWWMAAKLAWTIIKVAIQGIVIGFQLALAFITSAVKSIWSTISTVFSAIGSFIMTAVRGWLLIITTVWNAVRSFVTGAVSAVRNTVVAAFNAISTGVRTAMTAVMSVISGLWNRISSVVSSIPSKMLAFGKSIIQSLANGISTAWNVVTGALSGFGSKVTGALKGAATLLVNVGKDLIAGLAQGISGAWGAVKAAISGILSKISGPVKKLLGISSPSTVMRDQVGRWIPLGVAAGIDKEASSIQAALDAALNIVPKRPRIPLASAVSAAGVAGAAVGGGRTINVYPRAEHSEAAIARMVNREFGWAEAGA